MQTDVDSLREYADRTGEIVASLIEAQPDLNFITAHVMAADIHSAERARKAVDAGEATPLLSIAYVGSFARWDYAVSLMRDDLIEEREFFGMICDLWSQADPDDTKVENLHLWQQAKARNHGLVITDRKPLPRSGERLTIYRGGPPSSNLAN